MVTHSKFAKSLFFLLVLVIISFGLFVSPSKASGNPEVTLSSSEKLDHSQRIIVSVTGFAPESFVKLQQCAVGSELTKDCGGTQYLTTNAAGEGSAVYSVTRTNGLDIRVPGAPFMKCDVDNSCEIRATLESNAASRAEVTLDFLPDAGACPQGLTGAATGKGTASIARAFANWGPVICESPVSIALDYVAESDQFGVNAFSCGLVEFAIVDQSLEGGTCTGDGAVNEVAGLAPIALSGISFVFNVRDTNSGERVENLKLTPELLTRIFTGQLTSLDTPEIRSLNPGISMPDRLFVAVRADQAAATLSVTEFFHETQPGIYAQGGQNGEFASGPTDIFPAIPAVFPVSGEPKVLSLVASGEPQSDPLADPRFAWIGYASSAGAEFAALGSVTIVDPSTGEGTKPTPESLTAAYAEATLSPDGSYKFDYTPSDVDAYPLTVVSSLVLPKLDKGDDRIRTLESFVSWVVWEGQDSKFLPAGYAPLPRELSSSAVRISKSIGQDVAPTPTPTPTVEESEVPDIDFGSTDSSGNFDSGATVTGSEEAPGVVTEAVRLSAFTESQALGSPFPRILVFLLLGLFIGSVVTSLRPRK